jgi:hypothetical protein
MAIVPELTLMGPSFLLLRPLISPTQGMSKSNPLRAYREQLELRQAESAGTETTTEGSLEGSSRTTSPPRSVRAKVAA